MQTEESTNNIKRAIMYRLLHAKIQSFFDKYSTNYILTKLETAPDSLISIVYLISEMIQLGVNITVAFYHVKPLLNPLTIACMAYYFWISHKRTRKMQTVRANTQQLMTKIRQFSSDPFYETIKGLPEIRAMNLFKFMERHNYDKLEHSAKYNKLENLQEYHNQLVWAW